MDRHMLPGATANEVAEAHRKDLLFQQEHNCTCMTYWIDEKRGNVFCLIEAPTKEAVEELHGRSHGMVPNTIIEVNPLVVESFLGRITDPDEAEISEEGLKVFSDPSFRILLVTTINDPVLLQHQLGKDKTQELLTIHNNIIRKELSSYGGVEVEHEGPGFIASFVSAGKAVGCALAIRRGILGTGLDAAGFRIALNAGEPVAKSDKLFGDTVLFATHLCAITKDAQIGVSSAVKELVTKDYFQGRKDDFLTLSPADEALLGLLFDRLEENWQDPDFNVEDYCHTMTMSKSQLYRKTIALSGYSPNTLLKEFRLEKAKDRMKKYGHTISQVTFDSGFTSPSYFTKCFKKKFGLLPMVYLDMLH
jgi:AraC-like DNA-binding protein